MTEHHHPASPHERTPSLDTDAMRLNVVSLMERRAQADFIASGRFLTGLNTWLDRNGEVTATANQIQGGRHVSREDFTVATHIDKFVSLVTDFADTNYLAQRTQGYQSDDGDFVRTVNVAREGTTYRVGYRQSYRTGPSIKRWITRLEEPLPEDAEVLDFDTILRGEQTERARVIDEKLANLATFATGLTEQGVPMRILSSELLKLSEKLAEEE